MASQTNPRLQDTGADHAAGKDPLAELARLIGQNDGYAKMRQSAPAPTPVPAAARESHDYQDAPLRGGQHPAYQPVHHGEPVQQYAPAPAHDPRYAQQPPYADQHYAGAAYADEPYDPAYDAGYEEEYIAEEPKKRRGLKLVAAAVGLCVVGVAGAYAYRSIGPSVSGPPPVIKANEQPNKVAGTPQVREPAARTTYDRANPNQPERVVTREEQPVEIKDTRSGAPRTVGTIPSPSQATGMSPPTPSTEPKKVKTERILPSGPVTAPANGTGPRSDAGPKAAPVRTASTAPIVAATPPAPSATAGGHVVQVSSQKNEGEAKASFRALQAKYPSVLAGRSPLIRKAELGDRGTVYRVQLGPFASANQANDLCTNLKAAGGQCIVQRN